MSKPLVMRKRAKVAALIIFILALVIVTITKAWWPGIMLVVGLPLAVWQYLQGRLYDMGITLFVFVGAFATVQFDIQWAVLLPILFTIGGIYIFFREWIEGKSTEEETAIEEKEKITGKEEDNSEEKK